MSKGGHNLRVAEECPEAARVKVVEDCDEEVVVELERVGELVRDLPDAVDELQKDGRTVGVRVVVIAVSDTLQIRQQKHAFETGWQLDNTCD